MALCHRGADQEQGCFLPKITVENALAEQTGIGKMGLPHRFPWHGGFVIAGCAGTFAMLGCVASAGEVGAAGRADHPGLNARQNNFIILSLVNRVSLPL